MNLLNKRKMPYIKNNKLGKWWLEWHHSKPFFFFFFWLKNHDNSLCFSKIKMKMAAQPFPLCYPSFLTPKDQPSTLTFLLFILHLKDTLRQTSLSPRFCSNDQTEPKPVYTVLLLPSFNQLLLANL